MESAVQILSGKRAFMNGVKNECVIINEIERQEGEISKLNSDYYNPYIGRAYNRREKEVLKNMSQEYYSGYFDDDITLTIKNLIKVINGEIYINKNLLIKNKKLYNQDRLHRDIILLNIHLEHYPTGRKSPFGFYDDFEKYNLKYKNEDNTLISDKAMGKLIDKLFIIQSKELQRLCDKYNNSYN